MTELVVKPVETVGKPGRNMRAAAAGEFRRLLEVEHRQYARHDGEFNAIGADHVEISEIIVVAKEELGYGARRPSIDLGLQHVHVHGEIGRFGMLLRVSGDADLEVGVRLPEQRASESSSWVSVA